MYGFQKIIGKKNRDKGAFFHELFLRGRPGLSRGILRLRHRALLDPDNEPNLYIFPPMPQHQLRLNQLNLANRGVVNNRVNSLGSTNFPRTVHYGITTNSSGDIKVIPDVPLMGVDHEGESFSSSTSSETVVQGTNQINVTNAPLLEKIKLKQQEQTRVNSSYEEENTNSCSTQGMVRWLTKNSNELSPSYVIRRGVHNMMNV